VTSAQPIQDFSGNWPLPTFFIPLPQ